MTEATLRSVDGRFSPGTRGGPGRKRKPRAPTTREGIEKQALEDVGKALVDPHTPIEIRAKIWLHFLPRATKLELSDNEKSKALASLVALSKGNDGGPAPSVAQDPQDPD